jgi:hypothetical protein
MTDQGKFFNMQETSGTADVSEKKQDALQHTVYILHDKLA